MTNQGYQDFTDSRIKHLDMVQAVVARLGNNGFVVKGWAITVAGAFLGFGVTRENGWLVIIGTLPTGLFWFLDASFLRSERAFRLLFSRIRSNGVEPFFMNATAPTFLASLDANERRSVTWNATLRRPSLCLFYGALLATTVVVSIVLGVFARGNEDVSESPPSVDDMAKSTDEVCGSGHLRR